MSLCGPGLENILANRSAERGSSAALLSAESPTLPSIAASPLADALRLYRRICVLRALGLSQEAARLESDALPDALESVRASGDVPPVAPLLAAEEARVREAQLLAEVLAPLVAARLAAIPGNLAATGVRPPSARPVASTRSPARIVPSVADFIEGMLAQDRATSRLE